MSDYLYRVVITRYPEGALHRDDPEDDYMYPDPNWAPAGWKLEGNYVEIMGTTDFVWPVTNKEYKSRSTANKRAALIRRYGAECEVQRSSRITWPDDDAESSDPGIERTRMVVPLSDGTSMSVVFEMPKSSRLVDGGAA
ncbi:hypothetical protein ACWFRB_09485 [Rhodococcus sp. NPDC055112]